MSPGTDLEKVTSDYLFTRIATKGQAKSRGQWHFKVGNLARLDALSFKHDWMDGLHRMDRPEVRQKNAKTPAEWIKFSKNGDNETLFKHGINILDELDQIVARNAADRTRILNVFKEHRITHLNDGRPVEDIVTIK